MDFADGQAFGAEGNEDLTLKAATLCRVYGAGSKQYAAFLEDVKGTLLGAVLDLPKFVPGDVKNIAKLRKKKKHHRHKPKTDVNTAPVNQIASLEKVPEEDKQEDKEIRQEANADVDFSLQGPFVVRTVQRSQTTTERGSERSTATLRRSQTMLGDAEQIAMDEQVAQQLQVLVREKAELIKENSRLKNENEGLKTLLEYATGDATVEDDESDYETNKETLRRPGIAAWHPPELMSPTSFSSYGILGSTSSNDDKEPQQQVADEAYHLAQLRV